MLTDSPIRSPGTGLVAAHGNSGVGCYTAPDAEVVRAKIMLLAANGWEHADCCAVEVNVVSRSSRRADRGEITPVPIGWTTPST
jgi:hypothetical protein